MSDTTEANRTPDQPRFLILDADGNALGAVHSTGPTNGGQPSGRWVGVDTTGRQLFDRKNFDGAVSATKRHGRMVAGSYFGTTWRHVGESAPDAARRCLAGHVH